MEHLKTGEVISKRRKELGLTQNLPIAGGLLRMQNASRSFRRNAKPYTTRREDIDDYMDQRSLWRRQVHIGGALAERMENALIFDAEESATGASS